MTLAICEHVRPDGARCGSPAMRGDKYCYHHRTARKLIPKTNVFGLIMKGSAGEPYDQWELPFLDDPEGIQIGFMQLIYAVSSLSIDNHRAQLILSALRGAAANLKTLHAARARAEAPLKRRPKSVKAAAASGEIAG